MDSSDNIKIVIMPFDIPGSGYQGMCFRSDCVHIPIGGTEGQNL